MESGLNQFHIVFVVNEQNILETLCKYIRRMGFTVEDISSPKDISKYINNKTFPFKQSVRPSRSSTTKKKSDMRLELLHLLSSVSSNTKSVVISLQDLSLMRICLNSQRESLDNHPTLSEVEREHIIATLNKCGWRYKTTAKILGIDRTTLYRKMKKFEITRKE